MTSRTTDHHRASRRARTLTAIAVTAVAATALAAPPATPRAEASPAYRHVETFTDPAGTRWVVPAGVSTISVVMAGAHGGVSNWADGGDGALIEFELPVTAGETFTFYGSTEGSTHRTGGKGWANGGKGGDRSGDAKVGAGGGGASAIVRNGTLLAVAGGGGGGGGNSQVDSTTSRDRIDIFGGAGGDAGLSGAPGQSYKGTHPGAGGLGAAREPGQGGGNASSAASFSYGAGGGGGGGGYRSGNGGSSGKKWGGHGAGGGGGGGSSWVASGIDAAISTHDEYDGFVRISWDSTIAFTAEVASPRIQAGAPVYLNLSAVEAATDAYGWFSVWVGDTRVAYWAGYSRMVELNLAPGTHRITASFRISAMEISRSLEIVVPPASLQSGSADLEPVAFDLDDDLPGTITEGGTLTVSGRLIAAHDGDVANVDVRGGFGTATVATTTDASGAFELELPVPLTTGPAQVVLRSDATALLGAAELDIPILIVDEMSSVSLAASATEIVYGQPIDVTVSVSGGGAAIPTGFVVLADEDDLIALAHLAADGTAVFTDVLVHPGTTSLRASYAGDAVHAGSVSDALPLAVAEAETITTLSATSPLGHAGDTVGIRVTVAATAPSVLEPAGHVELLVDGEVIDTASIGNDSDSAPRDGAVVYDFDTDELPAGELELQARFVPGAGYLTSSSPVVPLELVDHGTRLLVSPSSIEIAEGGTALVAAHVEVLGHDDMMLMRQASGAPEPEGTVVAFLDDEPVGVAHVDPATGSAELEIDGLAAGSGSLRIAFFPDAVGVAATDTEIPYTVLARTAPAALPSTGASGIEPLAIAAAIAALLGAALVLARRRALHG